MHSKRQIINVACMLFIFCFISCTHKKTQTAGYENAEINNAQEIEQHSESNELQDNEADNFQGEYIFSSIDSLEYKNIDDVGKYIELDETTYIRYTRISKGRYIAETNYWLIEDGLEGTVVKYPNEFYIHYNDDKRFKDMFDQIPAESMHNGILVNFFYTGTGIALYCNKWYHMDEVGYEEERISYYMYFNKKQ